MGKRSDFERIAQDKYRTPPEGIAPLLPYLPRGASFAEPCAANGQIVDYLESAGHPCVFASDIAPERGDVTALDVLQLRWIAADFFITNPPWERTLLHAIIAHLSSMKPTWLLFDADWMMTGQAEKLLDGCALVVSIGRLKWFPGSESAGKDNCAWYLFQPGHTGGPRVIGKKNRTGRKG